MGILDIFRKKEQVYNPNNIERFIEAQDKDFESALLEVRSGRKRTHWIWYIFPQLKGPLPHWRFRTQMAEVSREYTLNKNYRIDLWENHIG